MEGNRNQWLIWSIVIGVIVIIFIAFNYQGDKSDVVPLSEIFPDDSRSAETEYEYIPANAPQATAQEAASVKKAAAPAKPAAPAKTRSSLTSQAMMPSLEPAVSMPAETASSSGSGNYAIQILSSTEKPATDKALEKARGKGLNAYIATKDVNGVTRYRIYVGPYASKAEADAALPSVQSNYQGAYILSTK